MCLSNSQVSLLNHGATESIKSNLNYKHGCVISKGKKKVVAGYNHNRSYSKGYTCCSFHAEIHAMKRWCNIFLRGKKPRYVLRPLQKDKKI